MSNHESEAYNVAFQEGKKQGYSDGKSGISYDDKRYPTNSPEALGYALGYASGYNKGNEERSLSQDSYFSRD